MTDIEARKSAFLSHLDSLEAWDADADTLMEDFARAMLENNMGTSLAARELVLAGIGRRSAKQVVARVAKDVGVPAEPDLIQRFLYTVGRWISRTPYARATIAAVVVVPAMVVTGWVVYRIVVHQVPLEEREFIEEVRAQLSSGGVDETTDESLLRKAARNGWCAAAKFLIDEGFDVERGNPLHSAATARVARLLLKNGADPNSTWDNGKTPLHTVDDASVAEVLIRHGANVNARDSRGYTPLDECWGFWKTDTAAELMRHGARVGQGKGRSMVMACAESDEHYSVLAALLEGGAAVESDEGETQPIHVAVVHNALRSLELLLKHGANPNAPMPEGTYVGNSLEVAGARVETLRQLFDPDAAVPTHKELIDEHDLVYVGGKTPLKVAEILGHDRAASILRDHGGRTE